MSTDDATPVSAGAVLSSADRAILRDPVTRAIRARLSPFLNLLGLQVDTQMQHLPSYVALAVRQLLDALARWQRDERAEGGNQ